MPWPPSGPFFFLSKLFFIKLAYQPGDGLVENQIDVITLMALRMGFSMPIYLIIGFWVVWQRRRNDQPLPKAGTLLKAGSIGLIGYYLCPYLDFAGLKLITAQLERLLLFTYPAFVLILGALFFGMRISIWGVFSIMIAYLGIAVVFVGGDIAIGENVPLGSLFVLTCALFFALYQLLAKSRIDLVGSALFTCVAMSIAALAVLAHFITTNVSAGTLATALDLPPRIYFLGFAIALFSTILPSFMINMALGRDRGAGCGYVRYAEPALDHILCDRLARRTLRAA